MDRGVVAAKGVFAMRPARFVYGGPLLLLAAFGGSAGCTHNYYYGAAPPCAPGIAGAVPYGAVCDVPPAAGGAAVAQNAPRSSTVAPAPRVVVSEPSGGGLPWRRTDPDSSNVITTRSEGAIDDPSAVR
jgi:hypothetical protein